MKRLNYIVVFSILGALILVIVSIVPAIANRPTIERVILDYDFIDNNCGFDINAHLYGKSVTTYFYDKNGVSLHASCRSGGMSATETYNGHTLTWHNVENARLLVIGEEQYLLESSGLLWGFSVDGY